MSIFKLFVVFVVCHMSFNTWGYAASDNNVLDQKGFIAISENKIAHFECFLISETNSKEQGQSSNLHKLYSPYNPNQALLGQNGFWYVKAFNDFNCELYTSSYFRVMFQIRVINALSFCYYDVYDFYSIE